MIIVRIFVEGECANTSEKGTRGGYFPLAFSGLLVRDPQKTRMRSSQHSKRIAKT